jgi:cytochrome c553
MHKPTLRATRKNRFDMIRLPATIDPSHSRQRLPTDFLRIAVLALGLGAAAAVAAAPPSDIAERALACTACHGSQGRAAPDGYYPRIAGKPAGYLHNQLLNFRDGRRSYPLMTYLVEHLSDEYLNEIAHYFAGLDLPYPPPLPAVAAPADLARGQLLALKGDPARQLPACAQCHGRALAGTAPWTPGLLGLPRDYLTAQLGAWRTGLRRAQEPDCMAHIARRLTPADVSALAHWLAAQPVPPGAKPAAQTGPLPMACGSAAAGKAAP